MNMPWDPLPEPTKEDEKYISDLNLKKAKFLVDESLGVGVAMILREVKWNVKDVSEVGLKGHPDENVYAFAKKEGRILLTHDEDFLNNSNYPLKGCPGIIILPGGSGNERVLLKSLGEMLSIVGKFSDFYLESKSKLLKLMSGL